MATITKQGFIAENGDIVNIEPAAYLKNASVSGNTLTITKQDNTTVSLQGTTQSDWNQSDSTAPDYVKNRTHYEGNVQVCDYTFNGDTTGKEVVTIDGGTKIVKISSTVPIEKSAILTAGGFVRIVMNGESERYDIESGYISEVDENLYAIADFFYVCYEQTTLGEATITEGVWFLHSTSGSNVYYGSELALTVSQLQKLDSKFIPTASTSTLGGVKVGTNLAIDGSGVLSATDTTYTAGSSISIAGGAISVDTDSTAVSGSTKPITSGAVYTLLGDVEALLASI